MENDQHLSGAERVCASLAAGFRNSGADQPQKETGQTLAQTLLELRLQKAMRLLKQNDLKIYEVAQRCGFHSSQYFAIVFYKKYHVYPSDILKEPYA